MTVTTAEVLFTIVVLVLVGVIVEWAFHITERVTSWSKKTSSRLFNPKQYDVIVIDPKESANIESAFNDFLARKSNCTKYTEKEAFKMAARELLRTRNVTKK